MEQQNFCSILLTDTMCANNETRRWVGAGKWWRASQDLEGTS